ncbi:branched-chain amino acid transaminase [Candidatus Oleimmundimicrobium sp.]|uniref:branched-chain amino acid transaminase n=1 Tax=Candidatus Oleimmundimicrobium sp. TaxID=3060597 RepID=UPI002723138A|nr:branched-chain amino acid transaminase [Candidatus Oleimmundimicrobium sp.]MDO8886624.1 branched-chain amino acid transaminase [Candidatus Oleimmundimicrobium sp.]
MAITEVEKIWMNGKLVKWADAKVHVLTHALHYGTGVFEGIRAYETDKGTAVFRLTDHIKRLFNSAKIYKMDIPYSMDEIVEAVKETIKANNIKSCYIRPIIYRGYGEMGLYPMNVPVDVSIAVWPWGAYLGDEGIKHGVKTCISSFQRISPNALPPAAKATGQYINSILAKLEAEDSGYDEAILLDHQGFVSEGPGENIFLVKDGIIYTPPTSASVLGGITRDSVMDIACDMDYPVIEENIVRSDLYVADEAFFTGTAAEVVPIREVDGRVIGDPGEVTRAIQNKFFSIINGEEEEYIDWLEFV